MSECVAIGEPGREGNVFDIRRVLFVNGRMDG